MSAFWGLVSLFWSSFLSATLLPGSSEVLLVSLLVAKVTGAVPLIVVATIGNTLGGMTNLVLGRILDGATLVVAALWSGGAFVELGTGYWRRAMRGSGMAAHAVFYSR